MFEKHTDENHHLIFQIGKRKERRWNGSLQIKDLIYIFKKKRSNGQSSIVVFKNGGH